MWDFIKRHWIVSLIILLIIIDICLVLMSEIIEESNFNSKDSFNELIPENYKPEFPDWIYFI